MKAKNATPVARKRTSTVLAASGAAGAAQAEPALLSAARYEEDVYAWAQQQCAFLEARQFDRLDILNLIDEVGDVGRREYDKLASALEVLLMHILKWDYQPERRGRSWALSIAEQRRRVQDLLQDSPSLKSRQDDAVRRAYRLGRLRALQETGLEPGVIPEGCPHDWDGIMNRPFSVDEH